MVKHKHHVIPKHAGGTNAEENIVLLAVEEHANAHRELYEKYGRIQDKVAWFGLAKLASRAEIIHMLQSEGKKGKNNPMFGKPAPNRGIKRPGVGGRKKGTKWSKEERETQMTKRKQQGYYDYLSSPVRGKKISESLKGKAGAAKDKKWFTNGFVETYAFACPAGFTLGRKPGRKSNKKGLLWYNNGIINKQFRDGDQLEGFTRGRIVRK